MGLDFAAYRPAAKGLISAPPEDSSSYEKWQAECDALCLHDASLPGWSQLAPYWCKPAHVLGLRLVWSLCSNEALDVSGEDLQRLSSELDALEEYWRTMDFPGAQGGVQILTLHKNGTKTVEEVGTKGYQHRCLSELRRAIKLAQDHSGFIVIC